MDILLEHQTIDVFASFVIRYPQSIGRLAEDHLKAVIFRFCFDREIRNPAEFGTRDRKKWIRMRKIITNAVDRKMIDRFRLEMKAEGGLGFG